MTERPVYVAVIGWLLIVIGLLSIISVAIVIASPSLVPGLDLGTSRIVMNLIASVLEFACGWFILKAENWARFLYLVLSLCSTAYLFLVGGVDQTMLIVWLVVAVLTNLGLFMPAASRFFVGAPAAETQSTV
jgi:hypothetical protein